MAWRSCKESYKLFSTPFLKSFKFKVQTSITCGYTCGVYFLTWQSIEKKNGDNVIGCLWEIDLATIDDLDEQEGVSQNIYQPMEVTVVRGSGKSPICLQVC